MSEPRRWRSPSDRVIAQVIDQARAKVASMYPGSSLIVSPMSARDLAKGTPNASQYFLGLIAVGHELSYAVRYDVATGEKVLTIER